MQVIRKMCNNILRLSSYLCGVIHNHTAKSGCASA